MTRKSIALLDLHSVLGGSWVGCDCDVVPELAKGSCQHPGALLLSLGVRFGALLDKSNLWFANTLADCRINRIAASPAFCYNFSPVALCQSTFRRSFIYMCAPRALAFVPSGVFYAVSR
jgi:hypothetical protein